MLRTTDRAWWPAVGAPLERGVRPHSDNTSLLGLCGFVHRTAVRLVGPFQPADVGVQLDLRPPVGPCGPLRSRLAVLLAQKPLPWQSYRTLPFLPELGFDVAFEVHRSLP